MVRYSPLSDEWRKVDWKKGAEIERRFARKVESFYFSFEKNVIRITFIKLNT